MQSVSEGSLRRAFTVIGVFSLLLIGAALTALVLVARRADVSERTYEAALVQRGINFRVTELEKELRPHVIWDEALENVDGIFDAEWITKNIGLPIVFGYGHKSLFILSGEGRPIYGIEGRNRISPARFEEVASTANPLVAKLRREEARWRLKGGIPPPLQESIASEIDEDRVFLTASVIQGDFKAKPKTERAPVLVTVLPLERAMTTVLRERYALHAPKIVNRATSGTAHAVLPTYAHTQALLVEWVPRTPGTALLRSAMLPLMLLLTILALIFFALFRASRRVEAQLTAMATEAHWRALHDPLTGMGNRAYLSAALNTALDAVASGEPFAILLIDLDHFKKINDTWGHEVGDEIIIKSGEMLRIVAGDEAKLARLGGDEFVVILPGADLARAEQMCAQTLEAVASVQIETAQPVQIACTIGAAVIDDTSIDAAEALRRADRALYQAKASGRGRAVVTSQQEPHAPAPTREQRKGRIAA